MACITIGVGLTELYLLADAEHLPLKVSPLRVLFCTLPYLVVQQRLCPHFYLHLCLLLQCLPLSMAGSVPRVIVSILKYHFHMSIEPPPYDLADSAVGGTILLFLANCTLGLSQISVRPPTSSLPLDLK